MQDRTSYHFDIEIANYQGKHSLVVTTDYWNEMDLEKGITAKEMRETLRDDFTYFTIRELAGQLFIRS